MTPGALTSPRPRPTAVRRAWVGGLPPLAALLVAAVAAGAGAAAVFLPDHGIESRDWLVAGALTAAAAFAQLYTVRTGRNHGFQATVVFVVAGALLLPPELIALMCVAQHVPEWIRTRAPWYVQTFNMANYALVALLAAAAATAVTHGGGTQPSRFALAGLAAAVIVVGLNHFLLALMLRLARGHSLRAGGLLSARSLGTDLVLAGLGVALAAFALSNPWLSATLVAPLLLAHRLFALLGFVQASEDRLQAIFDSAAIGVEIVDREGRVLAVNPALADVLRYEEEELRAMPFAGPVHPEDAAREAELFAEMFAGSRDQYRLEARHHAKDGSLIWAQLAVALVRDTEGRPQYGIRLVHDVTERRHAEDALRASEERFRSLVQNASDMVALVDREGAIAYHTPSLEDALRRGSRELVGMPFADLAHLDDARRVTALCAEASAAPGLTGPREIRLVRADGSVCHTEVVASNLLSDPNVAGIVLTAHDVTERKRLEQQLSHQAFHDALTDLPNRALFRDRLEHALARASRREAGLLGVLFLDLDEFKSVNDTLGHTVGDQLLVAVGDRLRTCLRTGTTAARFGGDEFAILVEDAPGPGAVKEVAKRILARLGDPFAIDGHEIRIGASIGVVVVADGDEDADELLRNADVAMYEAKAAGRGKFSLFEPEMQAAVLRRSRLKGDLARAIHEGELVIEYQPIVSLGSGAPLGGEALVRWQHPELGLLSPADFIPLAEETGLVAPLGHFVLDAACRQLARWKLDGVVGDDFYVSVNVSAREIQEGDFISSVAAVLASNAVPPSQVVFEITESMLLKEAVTARLHELTALGARLALDDFGTGYSSLSYLKRLPLDFLKIDASFVKNMVADANDRAIVALTVNLAHNLGLDVLAEGIETEEIRTGLEALGCTTGQGYTFSRPLAAADFERWVQPVAAGAA